MKFLGGLLLGAALMFAQNERAMHPRIAAAISALKDAREYMQAAPHDFGGHKAEAIKASNEAIEQLNLALRYRARKDH